MERQSPSPLNGLLMGHRIWFHGGDDAGQWRIDTVANIIGAPLTAARCLKIDNQPTASHASWSLGAVVSNLRYTTSNERLALQARQGALDRHDSLRAVLIPISKTPQWWSMAQDERRAIYERSNHTAIGLDYLPGIARQLHHCRDLGEQFDFLTWFEFAESEADQFRELLKRLRETEEWRYVNREVELWLTRS